MSDVEVYLTGGRTTSGVVRVGNTVLRPTRDGSSFVHSLLQHLEAKNFSGSPRYLGIDGRGREILSFIPGEVPAELGGLSLAQVAAGATLLRSFHDATEDCILRGNSEVVCHGDPSPCNTVFREGRPCAFIDFDSACPGERAWDIGYAAWMWLDIGNDEIDARHQYQALKAYMAAYGAVANVEPVAAVLHAQRRLCDRTDGPDGNREWASACLEWTEQKGSSCPHEHP
jgi:hypothetical protein